MPAMSLSPTPAMVAASLTRVSALVRSWPGLMPAATAVAAMVAASSRPAAVPFTDASADSMIDSMVWVSWPRPASLAWASSIFMARSKPPLRARPASATAVAPIHLMPVLNAPAMLEPRPLNLEPREASPVSRLRLRMARLNFLVSARMLTMTCCLAMRPGLPSGLLLGGVELAERVDHGFLLAVRERVVVGDRQAHDADEETETVGAVLGYLGSRPGPR